MKRGAQADAATIRQVYDELANEGFARERLALLNESRFLEDIAWSRYSTEHDRSASILIFFLLEEKALTGQPGLGGLSDADVAEDDGRVARLVDHAVQGSLDDALSFTVRSVCVSFLSRGLMALDHVLVQKAFQPLVSILIWQDMLPAYRDELFRKYPILKKRYKTRIKALSTAHAEAQATMTRDAQFISSISIELLYLLDTRRNDHETMIYCCRCIEFFSLLLSQLPTRRYTIYLLRDHQVLSAVRLSHRYSANASNALAEFKAQIAILEHHLSLSFDELDGRALTTEEVQTARDIRIAQFQRLAFTEFKDTLMLLALANHASICDRSELTSHLEGLEEEHLRLICARLKLRDTYNSSKIPMMNAKYLREFIINQFADSSESSNRIHQVSCLPTELDLFSRVSTLLGISTSNLPLPKLTLQYLSVGDFLHRSFHLYRANAFNTIRNDIVAVLQRLAPQIIYPSREIRFNGTSSNALHIPPPAILDVTPPHINTPDQPGQVIAQVSLDLGESQASTRKGWEQLEKGQVVYFVHLEASDETSSGIPQSGNPAFAEKIGLACMRSAIVDAVLNADGKPLRTSYTVGSSDSRYTKFILRVLFDPLAFQHDRTAGRLEAVYENFNLLVKRKASKDNLLPVLRNMQHLSKSAENILPEWLIDPFLGLGAAGHIPPSTKQISLNDTFVDVAHVKETWPACDIQLPASSIDASSQAEDYAKITNANLKVILAERDLSTIGKKADLVARLLENDSLQSGPVDQPIVETANSRLSFSVVEIAENPIEPLQLGKRKRGESTDGSGLVMSVSGAPRSSPFVAKTRPNNDVRFSSSQAMAILRGSLSGMTLINGPPGTGKKIVAAQIISNLYRNEPQLRTLALFKSYETLEIMVKRLEELDIDNSHIAIVHSTLSAQSDVDRALVKRKELLKEVSRLAMALNIPGDHGATCETADYFYVTVVARWLMAPASDSVMSILDKFFSTADRQSFPDTGSYESSCLQYLKDLFTSLAELRPLEQLNSTAARHHYLLTKVSRIVLATSDYASTSQRSLVDSDLRYDTLMINQASAIPEIESFIPMTMARHNSNLQRVVLIGDVTQIGPQHMSWPALKTSSNICQSLFQRLIRSGIVPIELSDQACSRDSIHRIFASPHSVTKTLSVATTGTFVSGNAGLCHTAQFVQVPDYNGAGEYAPRPQAWQNVGEAEYVVALYQYMRLLNYPRENITLLTPFESQKSLIQDVLDLRCRRNPIFGLPTVATIEEYQGLRNDYVLLSLVRTTTSGPTDLMDLHMMTTGLSRAKLGLYVFGRLNAMPAVLKPCIERLRKATDDKLELVTGEMYPTERLEKHASDKTVVMVGVEHLGKYVYEMTQKKLEAMSA